MPGKFKQVLRFNWILLNAAIPCMLCYPNVVNSQYTEGTIQYDQAISKGKAALSLLLESHSDYIHEYFPNKEDVDEYQKYRISYPPVEEYVITIIVNPCGANGTYERDDDLALGYDCCIERYGQGEYAYKPGTRNRFSNGYSNGIPMSADEPLHNIDLVDEFGNDLDFRYSRRSDDMIYIDETCVALREPHSACISDRFAAAVSIYKPPCWDHNETVDASLDCYTTQGKRQKHCMQISYSQNAYIFVCGGEFYNDDSCGTFLEVHKAGGTPYDDERTTLSDVKVITYMTNGMQTTILPLTYKADPSRILCSYEEERIREGSMVQITNVAPTCCCPRLLSSSTNVGAFFCPKRKRSRDGPFAPELTTLEEQYADDSHQNNFPWYPLLNDNEDTLMCSQERVFADDLPLSHFGRYFSRPCMSLMEHESGEFFSADLSGSYSNKCPLGNAFISCGRAPAPQGGCNDVDYHFSFEDEIGKVVHISTNPKQKYAVTFNDGRSVYWFQREELKFLKPPGNYEVWFVQRNRFEKIIQKKKPFRVVWPRCTFDSVNDRYFPFAQLDETGTPIAVL